MSGPSPWTMPLVGPGVYQAYLKGLADGRVQRDMLREALVGMVTQFCHCDDERVEPDVFSHSFLSAEEEAFHVLVECGAAVFVDNNDYQIRLVSDE